MASIVHARITFTELVNAALAGSNIGLPVEVGLAGIKQLIKKKQLAAITHLRENLSKTTRTQVRNLLVLYQEQLYVLDDIANSKNPSEAWAAEARIQTQPDGSLKLKIDEYAENMGDNFFSHAMLIVTRLTRTARRAYFKALNCGNTLVFHGPAGTGKTETAKDISRMTGREPTFIRCADTLTPDDVAASLMNVPKDVRTPVILDEFNRVPTEVQKAIVLRIEKERPGQFVILAVNPGYDGDTTINLPGLQKLAFTLPPMDIIAQGLLAIEGIADCTSLGKALISCITECRTRCATQSFYDYGMRTLRSIVRLAGSLARSNGYKDETAAVIQSVGMTLHFRAVPKDKEVVLAAIRRTFGKAFAIPDKCIGPLGFAEQALAMSHVRHGVCINGSTNHDNVIKAVTAVSPGVESVVINIDDKNSLTDTKGSLFSTMKRGDAKDSDVFVFFVLPATGTRAPAPRLIEPLNTLFDDNKKVVFDSGEGVRMPSNMRFFVVVDDCSDFSPASISRLGVVSIM